MSRGEYQSVICPYGYRKSADGRMEPDEDVASNVQMIFQWASEGNTAAEITRKLYAMNIPTPGEYRKLKGKDYYNVSRTNGVWSTSTVLRILEDQRYIGTYVIGKRKVKEIGSRHTQLKDESEWFKIPNHHPAIVSVDLFEKANASIKRFSLSNKNRVIICSAVRYSVDAAIMQCLYEMVRGFIAVIPRWLKRFLVMVCA